MSRLVPVLFLLAVLPSCSACVPPEADAHPGSCEPILRIESQFHYRVDAKETTPSGIHVDRSGQSYPPLEEIDRLVDDVEACLVGKFGDPPEYPPEVVEAYDCLKPHPFPFPRGCITLKVPDDWFVSSDGTQEILPFVAPDGGCKQKNPAHRPEDGCFWRAGLQCGSVIVSTPSLYVFKDPLIRMTTGCNNPWGVRIDEDGSWEDLDADIPPELRLSECASPGRSGVPPRSPLPARGRPPGFLGYHVNPNLTGCGY